MGSERVPEGPKMAPKTLLGPFGPILAYFFLAPDPKFFQVLLGQNRPKKFQKNLHYFDSQRVWDPQKPKIDPVDPPVDPIWAHFVGILGQFGAKKRVFLQNNICSKSFFIRSQVVWDPQKPKIGPLYPPVDPIWACSGTSGRHATRLVSHIRAQHYFNPSINC